MKLLFLICLIALCALLISCKSTKNSSKAKIVTSQGNAEQNLAAYKSVSIKPIRHIETLNNLPLYIDFDSGEKKPGVYDGLFWEIEPMGEYIYFLAGDYEKNEKGLLRFNTAKTYARVEINFEEDVIGVAKFDMNYKNEKAQKGNKLDLSQIQEFSLTNLPELLNKSLEVDDYYSAIGVFSNMTTRSSSAKSRFEFSKYKDNARLKMLYEDIFPSDNGKTEERYLKIVVESTDGKINAQSLTSLFEELISKYQNMPHKYVSGSTRM